LHQYCFLGQQCAQELDSTKLLARPLLGDIGIHFLVHHKFLWVGEKNQQKKLSHKLPRGMIKSPQNKQTGGSHGSYR